MDKDVADKIPSEVRDLVVRGIYSLFKVSRAPKAGIEFVLVTDKIENGSPCLFWLSASGSPLDVSLRTLADVTLGEKISFQTA